MNRALIRALRQRAIDVTTAGEEGIDSQSDENVLAYAVNTGRTVYTFNQQDFFWLHTEYLTHGRSHAGIVIAPQQRFSVGEQLRRLLLLLAARSAEEMVDRVEFLSDWG